MRVIRAAASKPQATGERALIFVITYGALEERHNIHEGISVLVGASLAEACALSSSHTHFLESAADGLPVRTC